MKHGEKLIHGFDADSARLLGDELLITLYCFYVFFASDSVGSLIRPSLSILSLVQARNLLIWVLACFSN